MAEYHQLHQHEDFGDADATDQRRRRAREGLRLAVGSTAAIALLVACAYTTLREQMDRSRNAGTARLSVDIELVRDLARDGLAPQGDLRIFGQFSHASRAAKLDAGPHSSGYTQTLPLGMNKVNNLKRKHKDKNHPEDPPVEEEGAGETHNCEGANCASGRLQIDSISPTTCTTQGDCIITFTGRNMVVGPDLFGHKADAEVQVSLQSSGGQKVTTCESLHWISKERFECTLGPGVGDNLSWNVSMPKHDYKNDMSGTGWTWGSKKHFTCAEEGKQCVCSGVVRYGNKMTGVWSESKVSAISTECSTKVFGGMAANRNLQNHCECRPGSQTLCASNSCGYFFSYMPPTVNGIDPDVVDLNETTILLIHGTNFGESVSNVNLTFNGMSCLEIELVNDNQMRCLIAPVQEPGIVRMSITVGGQSTTVNVPVKHIPETPNWPFTSANTFGTEQWNITLGAMTSQTGLTKEWFEDHQEIILTTHHADTVQGVMMNTHLDVWQAVAIFLFRQYLKAHFAADAGHGQEDEDGVYITNLGNKLNGNEQHDKEVLVKQLQVMEAATGMPRQMLARIVGDVVKEEPPCAGYPACEPSDSVGHRGWTWHWDYDLERQSWVWKYAVISDGKDPPVSCGYCDPVKVHGAHTVEEAKHREETCMHCVQDSFKKIDSCECLDFKKMCLQSDASLLDGVTKSLGESQPVAGSSPLVDPPWGETNCQVKKAATHCTEIDGIPSADGLHCCPSACGQCGGRGCSKFPGGASACCTGALDQKSVKCGVPPCVMDLEDFAEEVVVDVAEHLRSACAAFNGVSNVHNLQCCGASCAECGGAECGGSDSDTNECCPDFVLGVNKVCQEGIDAPCSLIAEGGPGTVPQPISKPLSGGDVRMSVADQCRALGGIPDIFGQFCCAASCGKCGGIECERRRGGGDACCNDNIAAANVPCGTPPCVVATLDDSVRNENAQKCGAVGGVSDGTGFRCCPEACGTCGGESCAEHAGGMNCCADGIDEKTLPCGAPPCRTVDPHFASGIMAGPLAGTAAGPMANGTEGQDQNASDSHNVDSGMERPSENGTVSEQGIRDRSGEASTDSDMRLAARVNACADAGGVADPFGTQCCPLSCGTCGGGNCSSRPGGADACCGDRLGSAAVKCGSPPCILESEDPDTISARVSACSIAGGISDATGLRCCSAACGACGGIGCDTRDGGAEACCADNIDSGNKVCGTPPCSTESKGSAEARVEQGHANECASNNGISDPFGQVCCPASCGICGGVGCEIRDGGAASCCIDGILAANMECGEPPCVWPHDALASLSRASACIAAGGISDASGFRCCASSCGSCGGENCMSRAGGALECCADSISSANVLCGNPPCLMESSSAQERRDVSISEQACIDIGGLPSALGITCCASSCDVCGGTGCESRPGGADGCCGDSLISSGQECGHPPCVMVVDSEVTRARSAACVGLGGVPDSTGMLCCSSSCASCGGTGCGELEGGADGCCADTLESANTPCGQPPCLMESHAAAEGRDLQVFSAECKARGGVPDSSGLKCCAASCGSCGGENCAMRPGGAELCCGDNLASSGKTCGEVPCVFHASRLEAEARSKACASVGGVSDPSGLACCPALCGTCGGIGCHDRPGGADECCGDGIDEANKLCGSPPCLMVSFSDAGTKNRSEWWRFNSGDIDGPSSRRVRRRSSTGSEPGMGTLGSVGSYLFSPLEMHDRMASVRENEVVAEWSPQDFVSADNYPSSRLAGGIGAAGSSIRDPTVLLCWSLFLLISISTLVYVLIYHREFFVPNTVDDPEELIAPGSPRSVGSV